MRRKKEGKGKRGLGTWENKYRKRKIAKNKRVVEKQVL